MREIVILRKEKEVLAIPARTFEPQQCTELTVLGDLATTESGKMMPEGKTIMFTVRALQRSLARKGQIVETHVQESTPSTAHHIANFAELLVTRLRSTRRKRPGRDCIGNGETRRERKQAKSTS